MRSLDKLFDSFTVAGLAPGSVTFMGSPILSPETTLPFHTGILRGKEVQYSTVPAEDPEGEVLRIVFPAEVDSWEL